MSFEGYYQALCEKGHEAYRDVYGNEARRAGGVVAVG